MQLASIPKYFLYGEPVRDVEERFLHVEALTLRTPLVGWHIEPHSHRDLHHLLLITRGGGVLLVESERWNFSAPALLCVPLDCVHGFDFQPDTEGWIVTVSGGLLGLLTRDYPELASVFAAPCARHLEEESHEELRLRQWFEMLAAEFSHRRLNRQAAVDVCTVGILVTVQRLIADNPDNRPIERGRDAALVARFRALVEMRYSSQTGISDYARRLRVSRERLRLACARVTGSSPLALLTARRLLEAKRKLIYTNTGVAQIATDCGFDDPAYFSRFFTRHMDASPSQFRSRRRATSATSTMLPT
jgi:AraC family transcriptional activator of pobA